MAKEQLKIGSIVIDCNRFDEMMAFWKAALHLEPKYPPSGGWVVLRDPEGKRPNISLNKVPKKVRGRNRLHFDLYTEDQTVEIERLLRLGARRHRQRYGPGDDFRVLEDPDRNLFCVVDVSRR
jgi:Glyoxalase-like domain